MEPEESQTDSQSPMLLSGMRVLSFCHYLQGPAAAQYLADMGADVIKVEPVRGAFERHWAGASTFVGGVSAFFVSANRNKRSVAVDLKHPDSKLVLQRLISSADVLLENYRPDVMQRLGLGYHDVRAINPGIIYASATGYGADGPLRDRPGQDLLIQARSGLIAATGASDPTGIGCAAVDQHGAALLAMGISAAYAYKLKTGLGTRIEGSLFNAGIDLQTEALTLYYSGHHSSKRFERERHLVTWFHEAPYGVYRITDAFVAISLNPIGRLAEALDNPRLASLADMDAYWERDKIAAAIAEELSSLSFEDLARCFDRAGIWYERVQSYDDLRNDPQVVHNGVFETVPVRGAEATVVKHPLKYNGKTPPVRQLPPEIGEHSTEIMASLGFSTAEIESLAAEGVIFSYEPDEGKTK